MPELAGSEFEAAPPRRWASRIATGRRYESAQNPRTTAPTAIMTLAPAPPNPTRAAGCAQAQSFFDAQRSPSGQKHPPDGALPRGAPEVSRSDG